MPPQGPLIEVGKWLIWLVVGVLGSVVHGQDIHQQNPIAQLSPPVNGWITELQAVARGSGAVGIYNFARLEDGDWSRTYIFQLEDDVSWWALFWPAEGYQLKNITLTSLPDHQLQICGSTWQHTRHCWMGAITEDDPWFTNWQHSELSNKLLLPMIVR